MSRYLTVVSLLAVSATALPAGVYLVAGLGAGLIALGAACFVIALLLGWQ